MSKRTRSLDDIGYTPTSQRRLQAQKRDHEQCCWPGCGARRMNEIPMCGTHLAIAHTAGARIYAGDEFTFRVRAQIAEPEPTPPPQEPQQGWVYYLRSGGYIKVGWTSDMAKRMRAYPPDSVLLATEPGTRKDEQRRHKMFAAHRTHGREWYAMTPSVMHHIDQVLTQHGAPESVGFAAQPVTIPQPRRRQTVSPRPIVRHVS